MERIKADIAQIKEQIAELQGKLRQKKAMLKQAALDDRGGLTPLQFKVKQGEDRARMVGALRRNGVSVSEIAASLGISKGRIYIILHQAERLKRRDAQQGKQG